MIDRRPALAIVLTLFTVACSQQPAEMRPQASPSTSQPLPSGDESPPQAISAVDETEGELDKPTERDNDQPVEEPATAPSNQSDEDQIAQTFDSYQSALIATNGAAALQCVSQDTIDLYQEHRDLAVSGDAATVKGLSIVNRMQVLLIRHRIAAADLKKMQGPDVFRYAVDNNWIGKDGIVRAGVDDIVVRETRATARVTNDGELTREVFHFIKEGARWKLDLAPTLQSTDMVLSIAAQKNGLSENEFLFVVISALSGRQVTDAIWEPLE